MSASMLRIVRAGDGEYEGMWADALAKRPQAPFWYLSRWQQYQRAYSGERLERDVSFVVASDSGAVAIAPAFLERRGEEGRARLGISVAGSFAPAPLLVDPGSERTSARVVRACYDAIESSAREHGAESARLVIHPGTLPEQGNVLREFGYFDCSAETSLVDLQLPEAELWRRLRDSYRPLINKARRSYETTVFDFRNPDFDAHEAYREMHHRTAGRVTRALETFRLQYEMLTADEAMLVGLRASGAWVAFAYCFHAGGTAYFGSMADQPDYQGPTPLGHPLIWAAIRYYHERKFRAFDVGLQQFGAQLLDLPSKKDVSISFFKRGFGASRVPLWRGVRYYNAGAMREELTAWLDAALARLDVGPAESPEGGA